MATYLGSAAGHSTLALTAPAGSNRACLLFVAAEGNASRLPLTSLVWGTEELIGDLVDSQVSSDASSATEHCVLLGPIPESVIAAQSGQVVTSTWTGTVSSTRVMGVFFSDATTAVISSTDKTYVDSAQTIARTMTVPTGGIMVAGLCRNYSASSLDITWTGGTETLDAASSTTFRYSSAYTASAGPQTLTADWSASGINQSAAMIAAVLSDGGSSLDPIVMRWQA